MKRFMITTAALALGTAAIAQTDGRVAFEAADIDDDGFVMANEIETIWPEFDMTFFEDMDVNGDNRLDLSEYNRLESQDILARYENNVILEGENATAIAATDVEPGVPVEQETDVVIADVADLEAIFDREEIDADDSGFVEYAELTTYYPGLEEVAFEEMDQNDDNRLDFTELYSDESVDILNR